MTTAVATTSLPPMNEAAPAVRWRDAAVDGTLLGIFMISACAFTVLLEHPSSPATHAVGPPFARRTLIGMAMGLTAVTLIYSPWGRRTGALMNPATTLCFLRLGRITPGAAVAYATAQFVGAALGVLVAATVLRPLVGHPSVGYVATLPGAHGAGVAWAGEFMIAFLMLSTILAVNRRPRLARFTGVFAGALVTLYITFEAPLSGMSLNPARSFGSAFVARRWAELWIYFTAPVAGMLAAVEVRHRLGRHPKQTICGKWSHSNDDRCVFRCDCLRGRSIRAPGPIH
jgi:aquaporin Z